MEVNTGRLRKGLEPVRAGVAEFARMVDTDLGGEAARQIFVERPTYYGGKRAYYSGGNIIAMPIHTSEQTTVHEMGHWLEAHNPWVHDQAVAFLQSRIGDETPRKLSVITGSAFYGDNEVAVKDRFSSAYMGKVYSDYESTEIIAMGLQEMWRNPLDFAESDPEYFDFMWSILKERT